MALTQKEIYDLNNSMVAAQNAKLGDVISYLSGSSTSTGELVPTAAVTVISASEVGLAHVGYATVALSGSIVSTNTFDTVTTGSDADGSIRILAWQPENSTTGSGVKAAATGFTKVVWTAHGTAT
jgi:CRISPR/Cas system type I-B associated protein Csh2 (Cas7 group RAMP superfamily)